MRGWNDAWAARRKPSSPYRVTTNLVTTMLKAESVTVSAAVPGTWQTPLMHRRPVAHGLVLSHAVPSGSATCVQPVAGSQVSAVQGLPSSHWSAVVQASASVVLVELEVDVDVEDVVAEVELEDEVLVVRVDEVEEDVLVVGCVVDVDDVLTVVDVEVDVVECVVDVVECVVEVVECVVDVEDVVAVIEVDEEVLVVRVVDVEVLVVERVVEVDEEVVVVGMAGSVSSFESALSVPSLAYAVTLNACPTVPSSPPTAKLMLPSAACVGIPALTGAP